MPDKNGIIKKGKFLKGKTAILVFFLRYQNSVPFKTQGLLKGKYAENLRQKA